MNSADLIKVIHLFVRGRRLLKSVEAGNNHFCSLSPVPEDEHRWVCHRWDTEVSYLKLPWKALCEEQEPMFVLSVVGVAVDMKGSFEELRKQILSSGD